MKKKWLTDSFNPGILKKWGRIMRVTVILIFGIVLTVSAKSYSQATRLDIQMNNRTIRDVISYVEENSEFVFLYKNEDLNVDKKVDVNLKDATINQILDKVLAGEKVNYDVYERQIIIRKATEPLIQTTPQQENRSVS
ncbi:MAG: STN domain-containing protein, partial [Prolixibacteraceae bacterium]|nr:STN domain-containing protein [Prolixibacteraceae bacterium]